MSNKYEAIHIPHAVFKVSTQPSKSKIKKKKINATH